MYLNVSKCLVFPISDPKYRYHMYFFKKIQCGGDLPSHKISLRLPAGGNLPRGSPRGKLSSQSPKAHTRSEGSDLGAFQACEACEVGSDHKLLRRKYKILEGT